MGRKKMAEKPAGPGMNLNIAPTAAKAPSTARVFEDICPVCRLAMTAANARALSRASISRKSLLWAAAMAPPCCTLTCQNGDKNATRFQQTGQDENESRNETRSRRHGGLTVEVEG